MVSFVLTSLLKSAARSTSIRVLALCLLLGSVAPNASAQTWNLSWSDEFTGPAGSAPSSANWTYDTGILNVNDEVEYYCAAGSSTSPCDPNNSNAYLDGNGHLVIQALRINSLVAPYSGSWTSARLKSQGLQSFTYGRIESSMALPLGPGLWPAWWALGTDITTVGWPASGEIDYMENVPLSSGLGPNAIRSTLHGGTSSSNCYCGGNGLGQSYTFPGNDANGPDVTSFHTYGAIWSPNMVQFYVDDPANVFFVRTASDLPSGFTWDFNAPFFLLLNLAVGGTGSWPGPPDNTTPSPAIMTVDYVRVYKAAPLTAPTMMAGAMSVTAGETATGTVNLTSVAGTGRVYLSCTTNAPKATCALSTQDALNQYTLDFSTATTGSASVAVTTTSNTSAAKRPAGVLRLGAGFMVGLLIFPFFGRKSGKIAAIAGLLALLIILPGCGGSGSTSTVGGGGGGIGTTPGTYTVTVNLYTVANSTGSPDAVLGIPFTVN